MSDPQQEPRFERPVLNGMVALVAVALGVGLILALVALMGSRFVGLGDGGGSASGGSTVRESMYLPDPIETAESRGPRVTLNTETPDEATETTESTEGYDPDPEEPESSDTESAGAGDISLQATANAVAADERIYFSGVYPGGEGAILWLQRFEDGDWVDFAASVGVTNGTFSSYIFTGRSGLNRFRVIDRDNGTTSNEIRVQVG